MTVIEIKGKQRVRKRRGKSIAFVIGVISLCFLVVGAVKGKDRIITGYEYKCTDTLWGLLEHCPKNMDRWEYLDIVMEINGMNDTTVYANRLYQVPIFE